MAVIDATITATEDRLVELLSAEAPEGVRVEPFPDDLQAYRVTGRAAILPIYGPEEYDDLRVETNDLVTVSRTPTFDVVVAAKKRRSQTRREGQGVAYDLVEYVLQTLAGERVEDRLVVPTDTQPRGLNPRDHTWRYQVRFRLEP
jgi:superfamily II DNA helicase RecQ